MNNYELTPNMVKNILEGLLEYIRDEVEDNIPYKGYISDIRNYEIQMNRTTDFLTNEIKLYFKDYLICETEVCSINVIYFENNDNTILNEFVYDLYKCVDINKIINAIDNIKLLDKLDTLHIK